MPAPPDLHGAPSAAYAAGPGPTEESTVDPRGLFSIGWLRMTIIGSQVASLPLAFIDPLLSLFAAVGGWIVLVIWSGLAVANAGRAKRPTRRTKPPSPTAAVAWWIAPVAVAIPALLIIAAMSAWVADATFDQEGGRQMMLLGVGLFFFVVLLVMLYQPYGLLGRATSWVGGDSSLMRRWFFAPFVAALIASVIQFLVGAYLLSGSLDDGVDDGAVVALLVSGMSYGLPMVAWLIVGNRAMRELEGATELTYQRGLAPHQATDLSTINPILAAQAGAFPVGTHAAMAAAPGHPLAPIAPAGPVAAGPNPAPVPHPPPTAPAASPPAGTPAPPAPHHPDAMFMPPSDG